MEVRLSNSSCEGFSCICFYMFYHIHKMRILYCYAIILHVVARSLVQEMIYQIKYQQIAVHPQHLALYLKNLPQMSQM